MPHISPTPTCRCIKHAELTYQKNKNADFPLSLNTLTYDDYSILEKNSTFAHNKYRQCMIYKENSKNPWEEIPLSDYENHMSLDSVLQLQTMNRLMRDQFSDYPVQTAMILGIAGGNGLEHVDTEKYQKVYGVDINADYLHAVKKRYTSLDKVLECLQMDLTQDYASLPKAELLIANLLIEYIGYSVFQKVVKQVAPKHVSCVIQINTDENTWVSDSPYLHAFDRLDVVHHQMEESELSQAMDEIGYQKIRQSAEPLPNGKKLVRIDFQR